MSIKINGNCVVPENTIPHPLTESNGKSEGRGSPISEGERVASRGRCFVEQVITVISPLIGVLKFKAKIVKAERK